ncbi:MAG: single-stranded DNA-binding protein [Clostridia bacterium]|nr:single-stranded DNA-binding protein [Clostridia bacterium]
MSLNLNKVVLAGRITADPELKQTPSGVSVLSFTIAVNRSYVSKSSEQERQADFINIVAWRTTAEFIAKYFKKGSAICVTGSIQTRTWNDNNGNKRYATEVVADEAAFVESRNSDTSGGASEYGQPSYSSNNDKPIFEDHNTDDDLPF